MNQQLKVMNRLQEVGRILSRLGHWGIPLSLGLAVGYGISDRGLSFVPFTLGLVIAVLIVSFAFLPLGRLLQGAAFVDSREKRTVRKRIVVLTILFVLAAGGRIVLHVVEQPSPLTTMSTYQYNTALGMDLKKFEALHASLQNVEMYFDGHASLFSENAGVPSAAEETDILIAWETLYDTSFALDQIRVFHEDWYRFDPSRLQREAHISSFVLMYAAELAMYSTGLKVTGLVSQNKSIEHFVNEAHQKQKLPKDNYSQFKQQVTGSDTLSRVFAASQYLKWLNATFGLNSFKYQKEMSVALRTIVENEAVLERNPLYRKAISGLRADVQPLKRQIRRKWLPTQKKVAMTMGDTKVRRVDSYFITHAQQKEAVRHLRPGDILLTRKNWYLSNVGLPGFWPHAILYVGSPKQLGKYFNTLDVRQMIAERSLGTAQTLVDYLQQTYPRKWKQFVTGEDETPYRLIEAVSEGVIFNNLSHAAGDYMAALRPRLSKKQKAIAIINAFHHHGKPYDFDFDFATDNALVCTELVWRSYREMGEQSIEQEGGQEGLAFPLVNIMGRQTLPANEIAALYARERKRKEPQLDFVYFIDSSENSKEAFVSTEEAFAKSWQRTKWDMALP